MLAFILAGGLGIRLRESIPEDVPKPMAPINGVPFLELLIKSLISKGLRRLIFLVGYKGNVIESYFIPSKYADCTFGFSIEDTPLGTGGSVKKALRSFCERDSELVVVVNGDTYFDVDLDELIFRHVMGTPLATLALTRVKNAGRYGVVTVNGHGLIKYFKEKDSLSKVGTINAGIYVTSKKLISYLPDGFFSMESEVFPQLASQDLLHGVVQNKKFIDIGIPETYLEFQQWVQNGQIKL